jgi:hypothetical protein
MVVVVISGGPIYADAARRHVSKITVCWLDTMITPKQNGPRSRTVVDFAGSRHVQRLLVVGRIERSFQRK